MMDDILNIEQLFFIRLKEVNILFFPDDGRLCYDGNEVKLTKQSSSLLCYLCQQEGVPLTRERIIDEYWGSRGTVVSEVTVRQSIYKLRRYFIDIGYHHEVLQTALRNGYLLKKGIIHIASENSDVDVIENQETIHPDTPSSPSPDCRRPVRSWIFSLPVLMTVVFAASFLLRYVLLISPVSYQDQRTKGDLQYSFNSTIELKARDLAINRVHFWLTREDIPAEHVRYVYINGTTPHYIFAQVCDLELSNTNAQCRALTILGNHH